MNCWPDMLGQVYFMSFSINGDNDNTTIVEVKWDDITQCWACLLCQTSSIKCEHGLAKTLLPESMSDLRWASQCDGPESFITPGQVESWAAPERQCSGCVHEPLPSAGDSFSVFQELLNSSLCSSSKSSVYRKEENKQKLNKTKNPTLCREIHSPS